MLLLILYKVGQFKKAGLSTTLDVGLFVPEVIPICEQFTNLIYLNPVVNWRLHWCFKICKCNYDSSINY